MRATIPTGVLVSVATHREMPAYPPQSIRAAVGGVAIAKLTVGTDGSLLRVDIVEAPDRHIRAATYLAARKWKFLPSNGPVGGLMEGTIAFHFDSAASTVDLANNAPDRPNSSGATGIQTQSTVRWTTASAKSVWPTIKQTRSMLLDTRSRSQVRAGSLPGSLNIPFEELSLRPREFTGIEAIVLDCGNIRQSDCLPTVSILEALEVPFIYVAGSSEPDDVRISVQGTIDRGIELLGRRAYMAFLNEMIEPVEFRRFSSSQRRAPLQLMQLWRRDGSFERYLRAMQVAKTSQFMTSESEAVALLPSPIDHVKAIRVVRTGKRWYLAL
jgi:TonB family protein